MICHTDLSDVSPLVVRGEVSPPDFDGLAFSPLFLVRVHDKR